jgi:hypothetical protein
VVQPTAEPSPVAAVEGLTSTLDEAVPPAPARQVDSLRGLIEMILTLVTSLLRLLGPLPSA